MNQENSFNTQNNNEIPINQPLQNNQNLNTQSPKKKKLGLIIGIIGIIIAIIIGIVIFNDKDEKHNDRGNTNNSSTKENNIKQLLANNDEISALSNNGDLYYIGEDLCRSTDEYYGKVKKIASNVEKIYSSGWATYYIDKQQDLYYLGGSYNAGFSYEPKKDYSEVKDIVAYGNFCGLAIKNNNELYIKNNGYTGEYEYCGFNSTYKEFTKVADNVKKAFAGMFYSGYINNNNELYISTSNTEFKKVLDNVNSVDGYGMKIIFVLTNDNKLYTYNGQFGDEMNAEYELNLIREDVSELGEGYFKTINGEFYVFASSSYLGLIKNKSEILCEIENRYIYYGALKFEDIKDIIYYEYEKNKLIYISNDGKLVLINQNDKEIIDYNTKNLNKIYEFLTSGK